MRCARKARGVWCVLLAFFTPPPRCRCAVCDQTTSLSFFHRSFPVSLLWSFVLHAARSGCLIQEFVLFRPASKTVRGHAKWNI